MIKNLEKLKKTVVGFLDEPINDYTGDFVPVVKEVLDSKKCLLSQIGKTPTYILDKSELRNSITEFKLEFESNIPNCKIFYAMKSNDHEYIVKECIQNGMGIDVSSQRELEIALECGVQKMVFSGPAKTDSELLAAIENSDRLIIHIDSFTELRRLGELTNSLRKKIRAGVRIFTKYHGNWSKFGISITRLVEFWKEAEKYKYLDLQGIQCHMSWNESVQPYENIIKEITKEFKDGFDPEMFRQIKFIDLGGGFSLDGVEGYYPWAVPQGKIFSIIQSEKNIDVEFDQKYYISRSISVHQFAEGIAGAIKQYLKPLLSDIEYFFEPGRIISTNSMHIVLKVIDVKDGFAIVDGGTNMTGWQKKLNIYYPLINLTHPSTEEIPYRIYGSLCTPDDIWGYYCYASKIEEGDIIVAPYRGAYTYAFRQEFIKGVPEVIVLE